MAKNISAAQAEMKGWLYKWTNYLKGYQKRWFVIKEGFLSYYRCPEEVAYTCRGAINLVNAVVYAVDSYHFVISNGGTLTFHLKASNEMEQQHWVTALELAKVRAIQKCESDEDEDFNTFSDKFGKNELKSVQETLCAKLEDLSTCKDLVLRHSTALKCSLSEVGSIETVSDAARKIKNVNNMATLFRITSDATVKACQDFKQLYQSQGCKWQKMLQHEYEQRLKLEEMVEQLAKQHSDLERTAKEASANLSGINSDDAEGEIDGKNTTEPKSSVVPGTPDCLNSDSSRSLMPVRKRRFEIPEQSKSHCSVWSVLKNCIGKELTKISIPTDFNEPSSTLQRLTEEYEYSDLLDKAAKCSDSCKQMKFVAVYAVSGYATTSNRIGKPFNPLLGETYDCDRIDDYGWRCISEQVSHHPPILAQHCEGRGWVCWQEFGMSSKFRGNYLMVIPSGIVHLVFPESGNHYTWQKITTSVNNIIGGQPWIDHQGDMKIVNHTTGDKCCLKFIPYSYFSKDTPRKVTGQVIDHAGNVTFDLQGTWDHKMESVCVINNNCLKGDKPHETIWKRHIPGAQYENMYNFTLLACQLNEPEEGVAPTDSRLRPDIRLLEEGSVNEANEVKNQLEEKQRTVRRKLEAEAEQAASEGQPYEGYHPAWFHKEIDPITGNPIHKYAGDYWQCKKLQNWSKCPEIFL